MNLILDTQTWTYLANGYTQSTGKIDEGLHFKLLNDIIQLVESGKLQVLINEVILIEWTRNKEATKIFIEKCSKRIESRRKEIEHMKNGLSAEKKIMADEIFKEYKQKQQDSIKSNQEHIFAVEDLLNNKSIKVPINDKHKLEAVELALHKKVPFHRKSNSIGDAIILISTADYLTGERFGWIDNAIFVSNNSDDYCEKTGNLNIHPELAIYFDNVSMQLESNLARALKLGDKTIKEIDNLNHYTYKREVIGCIMSCKGEDFGLAEVEFEYSIKARIGEPKHIYNPNQLLLDLGEENIPTEEELRKLENIDSIILEIGRCSFCSALHLRCECGEVHAVYDENDNIIECHCGRTYEFNDGQITLESKYK